MTNQTALFDEKNHSFHLRSVPSSRILVIVLFLLWSGIAFCLFGLEFGRAAFKGEFFTLGGPSVAYLMAGVHLIIAIGLIFYSIGAICDIHFHVSNDFEIRENRLIRKTETKINPKNITGIVFSNKKIGPHLWWSIFILYVIYLLDDGWALWTNSLNLGYAPEVGMMYWIGAIIMGIGVIILVLDTPNTLIIITTEYSYELQFVLRSKSRRMGLVTLLSNISPIDPSMVSELYHHQSIQDLKKNESHEKKTSQKSSQKSSLLYIKRLSSGALLLLLGLSSQFGYYGMGEYLHHTLYIYCFVLVIRTLVSEINNQCEIINSEKWYSVLCGNNWKFDYGCFSSESYSIQSDRSKNIYVFDWIAWILISIFGSWQIIRLLLLKEWGMLVPLIMQLIVITIVIVWLFSKPERQIITPIYTLSLPIISENRNRTNIKKSVLIKWVCCWVLGVLGGILLSVF